MKQLENYWEDSNLYIRLIKHWASQYQQHSSAQPSISLGLAPFIRDLTKKN